ncbi:uncharacterized protein LOC131345768 isoform X2 [Hemibagrus wyckioides]|uniref:uncharacterized protein LOC131345768 isoform X2 n=1 Tax=Hemibagrus wyckioides TaxID=337641 RepID=UPI00266DA201|nr:uncharacterized protein LOC131345768 isoform X2 [Hemibagrus wyckioides]
MNPPINFLVPLELVFKQSSSSCCSHFDIMRPRPHLTIDQQNLTIVRLQTGCSQREVATELRVSQSVISRLGQRYRETGRVTERHRSGRPLATSPVDDCFIVNSALRNRIMNATQLQAHLREVRGTQVSRQTIRNLLHQCGLRARRPARVPDHTPRHRRRAREHLHWTRDRWASVLFSDESRFTLSRNDGPNDVGDVKESAMHQPLLWWCYSLGSSLISPSAAAHNLGVSTISCPFPPILLRGHAHVSFFSTTSEGFLSTQAAQVLVQSLVISRLDYCSSLLTGLPLNAIHPLQMIQNAAV